VAVDSLTEDWLRNASALELNHASTTLTTSVSQDTLEANLTCALLALPIATPALALALLASLVPTTLRVTTPVTRPSNSMERSSVTLEPLIKDPLMSVKLRLKPKKLLLNTWLVHLLWHTMLRPVSLPLELLKNSREPFTNASSRRKLSTELTKRRTLKSLCCLWLPSA